MYKKKNVYTFEEVGHSENRVNKTSFHLIPF